MDLLKLRSVSFEDLAVVGKLLLPDSLPAVVAKPGFDTAATGEGGCWVEAVVEAVVGGILLQAAAITMKRFVAVWSLAIAEFITVFRVARRT